MSDSAEPPLVAISSDIGRGHPSYLDSVLKVLTRHTDRYRVVHLADLLTDREQRAWRLARTLYRLGGRGGTITALYNRLRSGTGPASEWQLHLLGRHLRHRFAHFTGTCLVDHPLVASILAPICRVAYLHGEIAAPASSAVPGAWRTLVPLETTAARIRAWGVSSETLTVTGLVIEPELVPMAEPAFESRLMRCGSSEPLTVALFTSGAYPHPHVEQLARATASLRAAGHRPLVFAGSDRTRAGRLRRALREQGLDADAARTFPTRAAESAATAAALPRLDAFVAAAHERTGWAVGLGLPMFILGPDIGPFAPLNREFALGRAAAEPLADPAALGSRLTRLRRDGRLAALARAGFGLLPIDGAAVAARSLD